MNDPGPKKSAILVVDLVNDFVSGKFGGDASREVSRKSAVFLEKVNGRIPIIFTMDTHIKNDPEFKVWGEHCLEGTWGSELSPDLEHIAGMRVRKRHYDSFYDSDLDGLLRAWDIRTLYIFGISTDICVQHTAGGAFFRNYAIRIISDLCSSIDHSKHRSALEFIKTNYGAMIISSEEALNEIGNSK
ncbi:MAG: isochorismatase family cysteine hydrolase [Thermoplasmataceae archaeon]|jgi:nicotinamidase-related amidase